MHLDLQTTAVPPSARPPGSPRNPRQWYRVDQQTMSLTFNPETPYEAWEAATTRLLELERGIQWLIGDCLAFGEDAYGERYAQVVDPERYAIDTVERMARTARAIPPARRRSTLGYTIHSEVAPLPPAEQEVLLDYAQEHASTSAQIRTLAIRMHKQRKRDAYAALADPGQAPDGPVTEVAHALALPLPDQHVDLIVTSPPYGVEIEYGVGDIPAAAWSAFIEAFCREAYRILKPHGRLALNIPLDTARGGFRPTYHDALSGAFAAGLTYHSTIVWHDGSTTKGNRALGSLDSAARPYHVSQVEMIALLSRGTWGPSSEHPDDITHAEWQQAGRGPWTFPGESHAWEGYPAAFPLELPTRLIRYLSRLGDVIVDPFCGSGTTLVAAQALGRRAYGYDLDPGAIASTRRRLASQGRP